MTLLLSHKRRGRRSSVIPMSWRRCWSHVISTAVVARARYSASVLERETVGCFFDAHAMQFDPRKMQNPVVLLLVVGQPAQSASHKALKVSELCDKYRTP